MIMRLMYVNIRAMVFNHCANIKYFEFGMNRETLNRKIQMNKQILFCVETVFGRQLFSWMRIYLYLSTIPIWRINKYMMLNKQMN